MGISPFPHGAIYIETANSNIHNWSLQWYHFFDIPKNINIEQYKDNL